MTEGGQQSVAGHRSAQLGACDAATGDDQLMAKEGFLRRFQGKASFRFRGSFDLTACMDSDIFLI